jgi:thiamine-phosphate pyrophosphorylase
MKEIGNIQFITDAKDSKAMLKQVQEISDSSLNWLQFRMKEENFENKLLLGKKIKDICKDTSTKLIINDDVLLAKELKADGVHLGLSDMNPIEARKILGQEVIIGATCNTIEHIKERFIQGVDYIGLGPFRFTTTKKNLSPVLGLDGYKKIVKEMNILDIHIPIIAIGGIRIDDIESLINIGIHGIAISSLITQAEDKKNIINQLQIKIN